MRKAQHNDFLICLMDLFASPPLFLITKLIYMLYYTKYSSENILCVKKKFIYTNNII